MEYSESELESIRKAAVSCGMGIQQFIKVIETAAEYFNELMEKIADAIDDIEELCDQNKQERLLYQVRYKPVLLIGRPISIDNPRSLQIKKYQERARR